MRRYTHGHGFFIFILFIVILHCIICIQINNTTTNSLRRTIPLNLLMNNQCDRCWHTLSLNRSQNTITTFTNQMIQMCRIGRSLDGCGSDTHSSSNTTTSSTSTNRSINGHGRSDGATIDQEQYQVTNTTEIKRSIHRSIFFTITRSILRMKRRRVGQECQMRLATLGMSTVCRGNSSSCPITLTRNDFISTSDYKLSYTLFQFTLLL
mmetsp:Transcript_10016/g.15007  ORF Transcript_10016/g.15007 Transcript_10016/m.15007 type:complete len:208 (+) Transcript_10016:2481-3104(+)